MSGNSGASGPLDLLARFFLPLSLVSFAIGLIPITYSYMGGGVFIWGWKLRQFYVSHIDFFFAKRALVGTILYPLFHGPGGGEAWGKAVVVLFELVVLGLLAAVLWRLGTRQPFRASPLFKLAIAAFLLSPAGLMQLSGDLGRYDHLNIILLLGSALLTSKARYGLAGLLFATAALVHEAVFFYGMGPILAMLLLNRAHPRDFVACIGPALLVLVAVGLWGNLAPAELAVLDTMPGSGVNVWSRGVVEMPVGLKPYEFVLLAYYAIVPFAALFLIVRHNGGSLLRVFAPQLFALVLYPLGLDWFRWASLGFVSVAITLIFLAGRLDWKLPRIAAPLSILFLIYLLPVGPLGVEHPLPLIELVYRYLIGWQS